MASRYQSYLCHTCNTHISVSVTGPIVCPECGGEVFDEIDPHGQFALSRPRLNAVIVLRRPSSDESINESNSFEFYYEDNSGSGVQPFPASAAEYLMGSGIISLFHQSSHNRSSTLRVAVESLPVITIGSNHVEMDLHCAICTDPFQIDAEGRELPCKHIFHSGCILPWLNLKNSCPICRHELALATVVEEESGRGDRLSGPNEENPFGLVIWRSPGGGFGVRRFGRGINGAEIPAAIPVIHTEMETEIMDGERRVEVIPTEMETEIEADFSIVDAEMRAVIHTQTETEIVGEFSQVGAPRRVDNVMVGDFSAVGTPMRVIWDTNNEEHARERRRNLAMRSFLSLIRRFRTG